MVVKKKCNIKILYTDWNVSFITIQVGSFFGDTHLETGSYATSDLPARTYGNQEEIWGLPTYPKMVTHIHIYI